MEHRNAAVAAIGDQRPVMGKHTGVMEVLLLVSIYTGSVYLRAGLARRYIVWKSKTVVMLSIKTFSSDVMTCSASLSLNVSAPVSIFNSLVPRPMLCYGTVVRVLENVCVWGQGRGKKE